MTVGYCLFNTFYIDALNFVTIIVIQSISIIIMESEGSFIDLSNNEQEQLSPLETSPTNTVILILLVIFHHGI